MSGGGDTDAASASGQPAQAPRERYEVAVIGAGQAGLALGYYLAPTHWGFGLATEASRAILDYGFDVAGFASVTAGHFVKNPASGRVLGKLGFVETSRGERPCLATGLTMMSVEMHLGAADRR